MANKGYEFFNNHKIKRTWINEIIAEFFGTFLLVLIGNCAGAASTLNPAGKSDPLGIALLWGLGVAFGILVSSKISGGHLNPAVTLSFATLNKFEWKKVPYYFVGQYLGSFIASIMMYILYHNALDNFDHGTRQVVGVNGTASLWTTFPQTFVTDNTAVFDQVLGTGILMFLILAITDAHNLQIPSQAQPLFVGMVVMSLVYAMGLNCMAILNPARDLAPRLFTLIFGWGSETFNYRHFWWVGIVGPHVGAIIGGWLYYLGIEIHRPTEYETPSSEKEHYQQSDRF